MAQIPMTVEGEATLRAELDHLKRIERPRITQAIAEARAHGDLKENAEYHAAREQQGFTEGRIQEIEGKLSNARVIDITKIPVGDKVIFGCTVDILNTETGENTVFKIVGDDEADVAGGKISINSPIARGMIGKEVGDTVKISTPKGEVEYEIDSVKHL